VTRLCRGGILNDDFNYYKLIDSCVESENEKDFYYGTGDAHIAVWSSVRRQRAVIFIVSCSLFLILS